LVLVEQPDGTFRRVKGRTDWPRVDRMTDDEIAAASTGDDDAPELVAEVWERARPVFPKARERVTMRRDADLLQWFRPQGRGYQTWINAVLRGYVEHWRGDRPTGQGGRAGKQGRGGEAPSAVGLPRAARNRGTRSPHG
jgi:uncharacterized protein (DUF4415 family)